MGPMRGEGSKDLDLVHRVLRGDSQARTTFIERMRCVPPFLRVLHVRLGSPLPEEDLGDLVQDALVLIWGKLPVFEGRSKLETWAYCFCQFELMNRVRRHAANKRVQNSDLHHVPSKGGEASSQRWLVLDAALRQLPPEEEDVLRLKHLEALSFEQIGTQRGISTSKAKRLHYGGLERLKRIMDPDALEDPR